jgi:transposase
MPFSAALPITAGDLVMLRSWASATQAPAVLVQGAGILLLAAEGMCNAEIAEWLGISRPTVIAWRKRSAREGLSGRLADRSRRGRPQFFRRDRRAEILAATLSPSPEQVGVTRWSSQRLTTELGVSHGSRGEGAEHDLWPW